MLLTLLLQSAPAFATDPRIAELVRSVSPQEMRRTVEDLVGFHTRHTGSEGMEGDRGIAAARRYLLGRLRDYAHVSGGRLVVEEDAFDAEGRRLPKTRTANVLATLRGAKDPDRLYVVSGHYDSRARDGRDAESQAPGANDDASGTAVVVELARLFSTKTFDATIVFALYTGEEQGLLGSTHHAKRLQEAGAFVDGMITNDIVGNTLGGNGVRDNRTLRVFSRSAEGSDSPSRQLARLVEDAAETYVRDLEVKLVFRLDRFGRGGDHRPFDEAGYAAVRFTEPNENYRHQHEDMREEDGVQYGDRLEFVDFDYAAKVTSANAAVLANLALAPRPPRAVRARGAVAYDTKVSWEPSEADDLAGYEVVWRDTTEPRWTGSRFVGLATEATLPFSLDERIVGVRALDREGHRSRVAVSENP